MKTILESLRIYSRQPLPGDPPEIMPWDATDPWAWDGAARHTLGLLLAGEAPGQESRDNRDSSGSFGSTSAIS